MATVDELLTASADAVNSCVIDSVTRLISVPSEYQCFGVTSDEKVTRIPFTCPKIVGDNVDLTEYDLYINYKNSSGYANIYPVEDVTVSGDNITFSWLLSRYVTASPGNVNYIVCAKKRDGTNVINEWNTKVATAAVSNGLEVTQEIEEQNTDLIEKILLRLNALEEGESGSTSPISKIESLDKTDMKVLRNLDSGSYILYGYFKPYAGASVTTTFSSNLLVNVLKSTSKSYVQIFYPYNNCVQYLEITDTTYERKNIYLNEVIDNTSSRHTHNNKSVLDGITGLVTAENVRNPDNLTDLVQYAALQVAVPMVQQPCANALKGIKTGDVIRIDDASPLEHYLTVKIENSTLTDLSSVIVKKYGKNLMPYPYTSATQTVNGVTFTINSDGTIVANGTATSDTTLNLQRWKTVSYDPGKYFFSGSPAGSSSTTYCINYAAKYNDTELLDEEVYEDGYALTASDGVTSIYAQIYIKSGVIVDNLIFDPQVELGSVKTDRESYVVPTSYTSTSDGTVSEIKSSTSTLTLMTETAGTTINVEYNKDANSAIAKVKEDKFVIASSTSGSTKKFKITVDDSGTISATEVIE